MSELLNYNEGIERADLSDFEQAAAHFRERAKQTAEDAERIQMFPFAASVLQNEVDTDRMSV